MKSFTITLLLAIGLLAGSAASLAKNPVQPAASNTNSKPGAAKKDKIPQWLQKLIKELKTAPPANPPARIVRYKYGQEVVYYQPPKCCDIPGKLYDSKGKVICEPDGGMSGKGDGKCPDFFDERKEEKIIWADHRKRK